jgi:diguanylate cyclase
MPTNLLDKTQFLRELRRIAPETPLAVAVGDIDGFKSLNDSFGQRIGDRVLRSFERTLTGSLDDKAIVGRVGGDQYAAALRHVSAESALILMEEIRGHFSSSDFHVEWRPAVSIGVAARPPHADDNLDLYRAAEEALYRAKREGRNRVAIYVEEKMTLKSNYYTKASLDRLAKLSVTTGRTEASLLREGLEDLLDKYRRLSG